MWNHKRRNAHRLAFVEGRLREVRDQQRGLVARAADAMTSAHYSDQCDPEAPRAVCELMGQARQAAGVLDRYLDEWATLRTLVT